jgi:hypothetical protein
MFQPLQEPAFAKAFLLNTSNGIQPDQEGDCYRYLNNVECFLVFRERHLQDQVCKEYSYDEG